MSEVETPSGLVGPVPVIVELAATDGPAIKEIAAPFLTKGVRICGTLLSAFVDFKVHVEIPNEFVTEQAVCVLAAPVLVAPKVGVTPATGLLYKS